MSISKSVSMPNEKIKNTMFVSMHVHVLVHVCVRVHFHVSVSVHVHVRVRAQIYVYIMNRNANMNMNMNMNTNMNMNIKMIRNIIVRDSTFSIINAYFSLGGYGLFLTCGKNKNG